MLEELTKKILSKRKSNQNVKAKRGSSREVYFEVNWEWFGGVFRAATLKFEHRLRYGFLLSWLLSQEAPYDSNYSSRN